MFLESILVMESVKMHDSGTYKCIGSNNDTTDTKEIKVTVIGKDLSLCFI